MIRRSKEDFRFFPVCIALCDCRIQHWSREKLDAREEISFERKTAACTAAGVPFCSEAWDAVSRYIYTGLQGGAIMHGWMNDDRVMITCCNDGTRPVIFKIKRIDYE